LTDHFYSIIYVVTILESACGQKTYFLEGDDPGIFFIQILFQSIQVVLAKRISNTSKFQPIKSPDCHPGWLQDPIFKEA
jgi:hypothetical protein